MKREVLRQPQLDFGDKDLPPYFWDKLIQRLREEGIRWAPVTEVRMNPFIVSYIHASLIESMLLRAQARGLIDVETRYSHHQGPLVPPTAFRVFIPK